MDIKKSDRGTLKSYFAKNAVPTAGNFADLIDGMLNQKEDGIAKVAGEPLSVQADSASIQKVLNFYMDFADAKPAWTLSLNPLADPKDPKSAKPGWSVGDSDGNSKLFIDQSTGYIGVGTVQPAALLHLVGSGGPANGLHLSSTGKNTPYIALSPGLKTPDAGALIFGDGTGWRFHIGKGKDNGATKFLTVTDKGHVGIGTDTPSQRLHVQGGNGVINNVFLGDVGHGNDWAGFSHSAVPTKTSYGFLHHKNGQHALINKKSGAGHIGFRINNADKMVLLDNGNVGIGTNAPVTALEVRGAAAVNNGSGYAVKHGRMASGSLTIGGVNTNYGGGRSWNSNTAGLLLETRTNTEIAVHDSGTRITSLMYYEGDAANRVTIGRDMGWGGIGQLVLNGNVGIGTTSPNAKLEVQGSLIRRIRVATGLGPNDGTDNGQIKSRVLTFSKERADTAIRIFYCDNFRVNGANVAARWEVRIDGKTAPGGGIYQDKYGSVGNYHAPATILGYAVGLSAGKHTVGVWVSPVRGYKADAYTGWSSSRWTIEVQEVWL